MTTTLPRTLRPPAAPATAAQGPDIAAPATADPSLFLVAPTSLTGWFTDFVAWSAADDLRYLGEGPETDLPTIRRALTAGGLRRTAVLLSSHETLLRDRDLADALLADGHRVVSQSRRAARLGTDKVAMKRFFDQYGFRSPAWQHPDGGTLSRSAAPSTPESMVVVKKRHGTQSTGTRLTTFTSYRPRRGEFCEQYHDGVEYSVVVYRQQGSSTIFPPVWKGQTTPDLVPPWRRLRLCPAPDLTPARQDALCALATAIAESAGVEGHVEVELLVTDAGEVYVLEINPRICGTFRLIALATGSPIFSLHRGSYPALPPAVRYAAEVPYHGVPFSSPADGVFATSRLTVAADHPDQVRARLRRHGVDPAWDGPLWSR